MEHVEPVKIDRGCGHSVMSEAEGLSNLLDKPGMYDYSSKYSDLLYSSYSDTHTHTHTHTQCFNVKDVALMLQITKQIPGPFPPVSDLSV